MRITGQLLDAVTVLVAIYDPAFEADWEFCALFKAEPTEQTVQMVSRHMRDPDNPEDCELLPGTGSNRSQCDVWQPYFYRKAMEMLNFKLYDDSLPSTQKELPLPKDPQK